MIRITERTTRIVCRVAFAVGCVAPTAFVLALCIWQTLPFADYAMERHLTATLGLHATVEDVESPRLNRLRLHELQLHDPETNALIATAGRIDAGHVGGELVVWMRGVEVTAEGTAAIEELLLRRVRQRLAPDAPVVRLVMSDLTIATSDEPQSFATATVHFEPFPNGAQARVRLATANETAPIRLRLFRRCVPVEGLLVEWNNEAQPLPCQMVGSLLPKELMLGEASQFAGKIRLEYAQGNWKGQINGALKGIDFSEVESVAGEPTIRARGSLDLERVVFDDGRIVSSAGTLMTGSGDVSTARLAAIADSLQLGTDFLVDPPAEPRLAFEQAAFRFELDADGLRLTGMCDSGENALISDEWGPLVFARDDRRLSIAQVIEAAAPRSHGRTVDADKLSRRLPPARREILETADRQPHRFER